MGFDGFESYSYLMGMFFTQDDFDNKLLNSRF